MKFLPALVFLFSFTYSIAQNNSTPVIDSLQLILKSAKEDTNKVKTLNNLAWELKQNNLDTAIALSNVALKLATQLKWERGIAGSYRKLGVFNWLKGNYPTALNNYFEALKINEAQNDKQGIFATCQNIAIIYNSLSQQRKALVYYMKALKLAEEMNDKNKVGLTLGNMAGLYHSLKDYKKALEYYEGALKIEEELGNKNEIAREIGNIGNIYSAQKNYAIALAYLTKAVKMFEELGDDWSLAINNGNLGKLYSKTNRYDEAEKCLLKSLDFSYKMQALDFINEYENELSELYEKKGEPLLALKHYKKHIAAKDSLYNEQNLREQTQTEMNFEFEKKQALDKALANEALKQQKLQRNYFIAGFILMIGLAFFIFRSYRLKQKANVDLEQKNMIIEEKQKEILSSINYAKRIQKAQLPTDKYVSKNIERLKK